MDELRISDTPRVGNSATCSRRILVSDSGNNRNQAFDAQGNDLVKAIMPVGSGLDIRVFSEPNDGYSGPFSAPHGVIADSMGNIIVADTGNRRVATIRGAFPPPKGLMWLPLVVR